MDELRTWALGGMGAIGAYLAHRPSPHFTWSEWTAYSKTLHPTVKSNVPGVPEAVCIILTSRFLLEPLRQAVGPVYISEGGGYRSPDLNADVSNSASDSEHMDGLGADIKASGMSNEDIAAWFYAHRDTIPIGQCIWYTWKGHCHVSLDAAHLLDPENARQDFRESFQAGSGGTRTWKP